MFFLPTNRPAYKQKDGGTTAAAPPPSGPWSWLMCLLGIGSGPTYRTKTGAGVVPSTVERGGWTPAAPAYKTAPTREVVCVDELGLTDDCPCDEETGELLREIHVYPDP